MEATQRPVDDGTTNSVNGSGLSADTITSQTAIQPQPQPHDGQVDDKAALSGVASALDTLQPTESTDDTPEKTPTQHPQYEGNLDSPDCAPLETTPTYTRLMSSMRPHTSTLSEDSTGSSDYPRTSSDFLAVLHESPQPHPTNRPQPRQNQQLYFSVKATAQDRSSSRDYYGTEPVTSRDVVMPVEMFDKKPAPASASTPASDRTDRKSVV